MTPQERLDFVVSSWEEHRPTQWIARELDREPEEIAHVLRVAGLKPRNFRGDLTRYDQMDAFIADGMSHSEIARTLNCDPRTLQTWFPGTAWESGGWARTAASHVREANAMLRRIDDNGRLRSRRNNY